MESVSSEKSGKTEPSPEMSVTFHLVCPQESVRSAVQGAALSKPSMAPSIWDPAQAKGHGTLVSYKNT